MPRKGLFPEPLGMGDIVRVISPAGPVEEHHLRVGVKVMEGWGYRVETARHVLAGNGYLAGADEERLQDFIDAMTDDRVRCIICSRGGYGSMRLLDLINWRDFAGLAPKAFVGFSDISALQLALLSELGWVSFSGPQAGKSLGGGVTERSAQHLRGMLDGTHIELGWHGSETISLQACSQNGECEGILIASCLSILVSLLGTSYFPDLSGAILCLEEVNEPPYRVDRMFLQLKMSGALNHLSGLVLGRFTWNGGELSEDVAGFALEELGKQEIPVWRDLPYGHVADRLTLPIGAGAKITADGQLRIVR